MESLPEFVGTLHIFLGPYRGNPIALYIRQDSDMYKISPRIYPWNRTIGTGENPNKAAADFENNWKKNGLSPEMYSGPHWEGGIKPEKPKPAPPPKPAAPAPKPEAKTEPSPKAQTSATSPNPAPPPKPAAPAPKPEAKTEPSPETQTSATSPNPAPPPSESDTPKDPPPATN